MSSSRSSVRHDRRANGWAPWCGWIARRTVGARTHRSEASNALGAPDLRAARLRGERGRNRHRRSPVGREPRESPRLRPRQSGARRHAVRGRRREPADLSGGGVRRPDVPDGTAEHHQCGNRRATESRSEQGRKHQVHGVAADSVLGQARSQARCRHRGRRAGDGTRHAGVDRPRRAHQDRLRASLPGRAERTADARDPRAAGAIGGDRAGSLRGRARAAAGCHPRPGRAHRDARRTVVARKRGARTAGRVERPARAAGGCAARGAGVPARGAGAGQTAARGADGPAAGTQSGAVRRGSAHHRSGARPRAHLQEPLSRLRRRCLADPDGLAHRRVGGDVRNEHPAATGIAPLAGTRSRSDAECRSLAQGRGGQPVDGGIVRAAVRSRRGTTDRHADHG